MRVGLRKVAVVASVAVLVSAGCFRDRATVESGESTSVGVGDLFASQVVSGLGGDAWIVGRPAKAEGLVLYTWSRGRAEKVADLARFDQGVRAVAFGSLLVVGGVRCATAACGRTVLELLAVDSDNHVREWGVVDSRVGGPDDGDSVSFVGVSASTLWVGNLSGQFVGLNADGDVAAGPIPAEQWTELCVIGSDLYRVEVENPPPASPPGVAEQVTTDPLGFTISRWDRSQFVAEPDGHLAKADSPGPNAFCAHQGFEVPGPAATVEWKPGLGWQFVQPRSVPPDARSGLGQSSSRRWYVIDASDALLELSDAGPVEVGLRFTIARGDEPPLVLLVDDSHDHVTACLASRGDLECRATPTSRVLKKSW